MSKFKVGDYVLLKNRPGECRKLLNVWSNGVCRAYNPAIAYKKIVSLYYCDWELAKAPPNFVPPKPVPPDPNDGYVHVPDDIDTGDEYP